MELDTTRFSFWTRLLAMMAPSLLGANSCSMMEWIPHPLRLHHLMCLERRIGEASSESSVDNCLNDGLGIWACRW